MSRIVVLSEIYYPEQTSTGYILTAIAEGLAEEYEVKAIAGPATSFYQSVDVPEHEIRNGVEIWRCGGTRFNKNRLLGRLANLLTRSGSIWFKALQICQPDDVILVVTNPPLLPLVALSIKWLKQTRYVLLIHDVYPEVLVATGLVGPNSIVIKLSQWLNRGVFQQASKIVTLGRDMTQLAAAKLTTQSTDKIKCIPNWADIERIKPTNKQNNILLQELGLGDRFIVLYAGNIGRTHGIEDIVEAAAQLESNPEIYFIIIGEGAKKTWLEQQVKTQKLKNISILPFRPPGEQNISLNAADVGIIAFVPGMAGISVPSRMYNQMAAGKPIIAVADDWSELARVVQEEEIGWVVSPGDVSALVDTILTAANQSQVCLQMGAKAAALAQQKYTFTQVAESYKQLFKGLIKLD